MKQPIRTTESDESTTHFEGSDVPNQPGTRDRDESERSRGADYLRLITGGGAVGLVSAVEADSPWIADESQTGGTAANADAEYSTDPGGERTGSD